MIAAEHTQSLTAFRETISETLDRVNATGEAELITVDGQPRGVLVSPAAFDEMTRVYHTASMRRAIKQLDAGEGQDLHSAMNEIRTELIAMKAAQATSSPK